MLVPEERLLGVWSTVRYAVNDCYFSYRIKVDGTTKTLRLQYAGSGQFVLFRVLLPHNWSPQSIRVKGETSEFEQRRIKESLYVEFSGSIEGLGEVEIACS